MVILAWRAYSVVKQHSGCIVLCVDNGMLDCGHQIVCQHQQQFACLFTRAPGD